MMITNMHDAVQTIGRAVGLADLAPNAARVFELVFLGQLPVYFQVIDDTALEVQLRLGDPGQSLTPGVLAAMLEANLSLQHGRLAVEPGSNRVVFCGRIAVVGSPSDSLMPKVTEIIREGASWQMERFTALSATVAMTQDTSSVFSDALLRV